MAKDILQYEIRENNIGSESAYFGIIKHNFTYNNEKIIREMVLRNSTVTKQEAAAVISLYEQIIREEIWKGNIISTGIFQASLSMRGQFESITDTVDYKNTKPA